MEVPQGFSTFLGHSWEYSWDFPIINGIFPLLIKGSHGMFPLLIPIFTIINISIINGINPDIMGILMNIDYIMGYFMGI